jgi:hypothetical protein
MIWFVTFGAILYTSTFAYMFYICCIEPQGLTDQDWVDSQN